MRTVVQRIERGVASRVIWLVVAALAAAGCAGTRTMHVGTMGASDPLVTLVVSEDRSVVAQECRHVRASGPVLGCQSSRLVALPDNTVARVVKIVRYTDALPSTMAMEIDVHELCHAVAALQGIADPCHHGNNGHLQSAVVPSFVQR